MPNKKGILQFLWFAQDTSFTYTKQIHTYAINYLSTGLLFPVALPCFQGAKYLPREFTKNQIKTNNFLSSAVEHETFATQQKDQVVFAKFDLQASCTFGLEKMKLALF